MNNDSIAKLLAVKSQPEILALVQALLRGEDPRMGTGLLLGPREAHMSNAGMNFFESRLQDELAAKGMPLDTAFDEKMRYLRPRGGR